MFQSKDLFDFDLDPILNFNRLFEESKRYPGHEPTAMTLATVGLQGRPSARVVLLKQVDQGDFVFYTNYNSSKGAELALNPAACLNFFWGPMALQIRVDGFVVKTSRIESETYFKSRPRLSQLGAWASRQSEFIDSYEVLQARLDKVTSEFEGKEIPCPESWGGYRLSPELMEFWFGMEGRLHYRFLYEKSGAHWIRTMKSP